MRTRVPLEIGLAKRGGMARRLGFLFVVHPGGGSRRGRERLRSRLSGLILSRRVLGFTGVAAAAALLLLASSAGPSRPWPLRVGAWLTYWDLERGLSRLSGESGNGVQDVYLFAAALSSDGGVVLQIEESKLRSVIDEARHDGARVWLTIVNDVHFVDAGLPPTLPPTLKDGKLVHRLLSSRESMAAHRDQIVSLAGRLSVSGIDLDYENLEPSDRDRFSSFVEALSVALRRREVLLSVTVQPKTKPSSSRGAGAADWRALCQSVDRLQVMLYNLHSARTEPGPMATTEWMSRVLRFALDECVSSRVVPVLKLSGMEWSPDGARGIQYEECVALAGAKGVAVERDEIDQIPHFRYSTDDGPVVVYFEDATSIGRKIEHVRAMGLDAILLWSLGREDPAILPRVRP